MENVPPPPAGSEQQQDVSSAPINPSTATAPPAETPQKQDVQKKAPVQDEEDSDFDELDGTSLITNYD